MYTNIRTLEFSNGGFKMARITVQGTLLIGKIIL